MAASEPGPRPLHAASAGLGLRRSLLPDLLQAPPAAFDFLECAPDNWIGVGRRPGELLRALSARHRLTCHGLSLAPGGVAPLDACLLRQTRSARGRHARAPRPRGRRPARERALLLLADE